MDEFSNYESNYVANEPQLQQIKKKRPLIKILIAVFCVLLIGGGVFAYKQVFQRDITIMVMGEEKYAQSLEKKSMAYISENFSEYLTNMVVGQATGISTESDFKIEITPENSFYDLISGNTGSVTTESIKSIIDYINTMNVSYNLAVDVNGTKGSMKISDKTGDLLSMNTWTNKDSVLFQMPDISDKYIKLINDNTKPVENFKVDSEKLNASFTAVLDAYMEIVKDAETTVSEDQTVEIADYSVTAKKVTITLTEKQVVKILKSVLKTIRDDEYLQEMVVQNSKIMMSYYKTAQSTTNPTNVQELTVEKYKEAFDNALTALDSYEIKSGELKMNSFIDRQNKVVARTYQVAIDEGSFKEAELQIITDTGSEIPGQKAINIIVDGKEYFCASLNPTSSTAGNVNIYLKNVIKDAKVILDIDYDNIQKKTWNGKDLLTGSYKFTLSNPDKKVAALYGIPVNLSKIINSSVLVECDVIDGAMKSTVILSLNGIGNFKFDGSTKIITPVAIDFPQTTDSNSYVLDPKNPSKMFDQKALTEIQTNAMKHLVEIVKRNSELADILASFGIPVESLELLTDNAEGLTIQ